MTMLWQDQVFLQLSKADSCLVHYTNIVLIQFLVYTLALYRWSKGINLAHNPPLIMGAPVQCALINESAHRSDMVTHIIQVYPLSVEIRCRSFHDRKHEGSVSPRMNELTTGEINSRRP